MGQKRIAKEYGAHSYGSPEGLADGVSACRNGCGCWKGTKDSGTYGGPAGLDPFGKCPGNPKNGKWLGPNPIREHALSNLDRDHVIQDRIDDLTRCLEAVSPGDFALAEELQATKAELAEKNRLLDELRCLLLGSSARASAA